MMVFRRTVHQRLVQFAGRLGELIAMQDVVLGDAAERALPNHRVDLGALALEREIAMAGALRALVAETLPRTRM
jgi:hypothetical protein